MECLQYTLLHPLSAYLQSSSYSRSLTPAPPIFRWPRQEGGSRRQHSTINDDATEAVFEDDTPSSSSSSSLCPVRNSSPSPAPPAVSRAVGGGLQQANLAVPHSHLQALKLAREAAENLRLRPTSATCIGGGGTQGAVEVRLRNKIYLIGF